MFHLSWFSVFLAVASIFFRGNCQEYDFAAEITRQCLVPDPVGLLDCVENKVTLPYLTSWVDCTNSLGQNVKTSADIINYRCKSVWEGKSVIPEVFYIKDCVIEKTGLPAKNVSAEVLGAYKECENTPKTQQQSIKTAPVQQQQLGISSVEYQMPTQQFQSPSIQPSQQFQSPGIQPSQQQFQAPFVQQPIQQVQTIQPQLQQFQMPVRQPQPQQFQIPVNRPQVQQQLQAPRSNVQPMQIQAPIQQAQTPITFQPLNNVPIQQFQAPIPRPINTQQTAPKQSPFQISAPFPVQQIPSSSFAPNPQPGSPMQFNQQQVPITAQFSPSSNRLQYPTLPPQSQQFFVIYPQAPLPNQQLRVNTPTFSQKTANPGFLPQQQISASAPQVSAINPNVPYSYSFQINHPVRQAF